MAIGSLAPQPLTPIGPATSQPLTIEQQYRRTQLKEGLSALRQAYEAGDAPTVNSLSTNMRAMAGNAGIPQPEQSRILQDIANPGPNSLKADIDYMTALTDDDSVLSPATKQTYSRDDLNALNAPPQSPDANSQFGTPMGAPAANPFSASTQISPTTGVATPAPPVSSVPPYGPTGA